jgi:hypothetical protein
MPVGKNVLIGVWEAGQFIGCVIFGKGVCNHLVGAYDLSPLEGAELTRVALRSHAAPVSRIVAIARRLIGSQSPGLRLLVSFADKTQGHHGGIYQADGWIYSGTSSFKQEYYLNGRRLTDRTVSQYVLERRINRKDLIKAPTAGKHRYLYPLDSEMRQRVLSLSQPYPKRPKDSSEPPATHAGEGGAAPTRALQNLFPLRDRMSRLVTG